MQRHLLSGASRALPHGSDGSTYYRYGTVLGMQCRFGPWRGSYVAVLAQYAFVCGSCTFMLVGDFRLAAFGYKYRVSAECH